MDNNEVCPFHKTEGDLWGDTMGEIPDNHVFLEIGLGDDTNFLITCPSDISDDIINHLATNNISAAQEQSYSRKLFRGGNLSIASDKNLFSRRPELLTDSAEIALGDLTMRIIGILNRELSSANTSKETTEALNNLIEDVSLDDSQIISEEMLDEFKSTMKYLVFDKELKAQARDNISLVENLLTNLTDYILSQDIAITNLNTPFDVESIKKLIPKLAGGANGSIGVDLEGLFKRVSLSIEEGKIHVNLSINNEINKQRRKKAEEIDRVLKIIREGNFPEALVASIGDNVIFSHGGSKGCPLLFTKHGKDLFYALGDLVAKRIEDKRKYSGCIGGLMKYLGSLFQKRTLN